MRAATRRTCVGTCESRGRIRSPRRGRIRRRRRWVGGREFRRLGRCRRTRRRLSRVSFSGAIARKGPRETYHAVMRRALGGLSWLRRRTKRRHCGRIRGAPLGVVRRAPCSRQSTMPSRCAGAQGSDSPPVVLLFRLPRTLFALSAFFMDFILDLRVVGSLTLGENENEFV